MGIGTLKESSKATHEPINKENNTKHPLLETAKPADEADKHQRWASADKPEGLGNKGSSQRCERVSHPCSTPGLLSAPSSRAQGQASAGLPTAHRQETKRPLTLL